MLLVILKHYKNGKNVLGVYTSCFADFHFKIDLCNLSDSMVSTFYLTSNYCFDITILLVSKNLIDLLG